MKIHVNSVVNARMADVGTKIEWRKRARRPTVNAMLRASAFVPSAVYFVMWNGVCGLKYTVCSTAGPRRCRRNYRIRKVGVFQLRLKRVNWSDASQRVHRQSSSSMSSKRAGPSKLDKLAAYKRAREGGGREWKVKSRSQLDYAKTHK